MNSSVSLRSRIREAQREVVKRRSLGTRRQASDLDAPVTTSPKSAVEDETYEAMPTVEGNQNRAPTQVHKREENAMKLPQPIKSSM